MINVLTCSPVPPQPDYEAIKSRQQLTWASGDFSRIGSRIQIVGENLCAAVDPHAGHRVLDVAAGNGNAALAAARCDCEVIATDYVPALLANAAQRALADGLVLETRVADAEHLPFPDGSFDAVLSTFGVMFAPNQDRAAAELVRVCRPGGKIGLASWTPDGYIGELFRVMSGFVPPPPGLRSPMEWGTQARIDEMFGPHALAISLQLKPCVFRYRSPEHNVEFFRTYYGPTLKAFAALPEDTKPGLAKALADLARSHNRADDGTMVVDAEYLEAVIVKR